MGQGPNSVYSVASIDRRAIFYSKDHKQPTLIHECACCSNIIAKNYISKNLRLSDKHKYDLTQICVMVYSQLNSTCTYRLLDINGLIFKIGHKQRWNQQALTHRRNILLEMYQACRIWRNRPDKVEAVSSSSF